MAKLYIYIYSTFLFVTSFCWEISSSILNICHYVIPLALIGIHMSSGYDVIIVTFCHIFTTLEGSNFIQRSSYLFREKTHLNLNLTWNQKLKRKITKNHEINFIVISKENILRATDAVACCLPSAVCCLLSAVSCLKA